MFHPSYVNRLMNEPMERLQGEKKIQKQNALPLMLRDMDRVRIQGEFPQYRVAKREFMIENSLAGYIQELIMLKDASGVGVDIETIRADNGLMTWCVGFAPTPSFAFSIPFIQRGQHFWTAEELYVLLSRISEFFLDPNVLKIFHGGGFDLSVLGRYYGLRVATGSYADTMWCHQATNPSLLKSLQVLTSIHTWEPYYKDERKWWDGKAISDEAERNYNCKDCCITREIWPKVEKEALMLGTWDNYQRHVKVMPSLLKKMIRGVRLDVEKKAKLGVEFADIAVQAQHTVMTELMTDQDLTVAPKKEINLSSPDQLQKLLYGYLGLPIQYNHKTKKTTTDKDALNRLRKKYSLETMEGRIIKAIVDHRKYAKLSNTYTNMEVEKDGRVRTSYGWVSTFRLNSSESLFGGGGNLQNIPIRTEEGRAIRRLFVPDKGRILLASDLEQAEARKVAWLAGDLETIEAFQRGDDVHWLNAVKIFSLEKGISYTPHEAIKTSIFYGEKTHKDLRDIGKTVEYADSYGMGPGMLQAILIREEVYLDLKTCKQLLARRRAAKPLIVQWQRSIETEIRSTRTLTSSLGDKREFHGRINDTLFRSAYSYKPQSSIGRILQLAIQDIHSTCSIFEPLLNVHDEVVGQCLPEDLQQAMKELRPLLEREHEVNGRMLTIPCSFKTGPNWGDLKEVEDDQAQR